MQRSNKEAHPRESNETTKKLTPGKATKQGGKSLKKEAGG
jgi:hypothetical protein